ncbi:MAG: alpha/beta fold hydrolase [Candidatus Micrarchaeota archaeon]|nr:alpha/beta fold hydrolase [Candidatus Micrarchaeota archaeon]
MTNSFPDKKVQFRNSSGQRIAGILQFPRGDGPFPAIVMCHGFISTKESPTHVALARELVENGFAVLRFDYSDSVGESGGRMENATVTHYLKDFEKALEFARGLKEMDAGRVGIFGTSLGGLLCGAEAAKAKKAKWLKAAVLFAPASEWLGTVYGDPAIQKEWKEKGFLAAHSGRLYMDFRVNYAFNKDAAKYSLFRDAKKVSCPLLIIHGTADTAVPLADSEKLFSLLKKPKKLVVISGADHVLSERKWLRRAVEEATAWFVEWVK